MLKALELVGFKSFADKTRFDFPAGITVVVGPNGSGKSNIVDGIKWVLGEQSAKSLRGKEMADVIFKGAGSTTGGRKAANTAEATLILENENRHIDYDADEIHVTRRVYRSGEGEYLINGEACRLKDIRDLFRGTGVGTDAYSLIEQGKVDRLLQASAKERRAIFEEAAGISRFKAKKIEAQRRLARVEQNLLRLSDIVEEVGSRYRSVKAQASKASRYREYSERLKFLRTQTGLIEFRRINEQLIAIEEEQSQIATEAEKANALIDVADREVSEFESTLASSTADTSTSEQRISTFRSRIAALESTAHHERTRYRELEQQKSNLQNQLVENQTRLTDLGTRLTNARAEQESAELAYAEAVESAAGFESQIAAAFEQLTALQLEYDESITHRVEKDRLLQSLNGLIQTDEGELKNVNTFLVQQQAQITEYQSDIAQVKEQLELLRREEQRIAEEAESKDSALAQARSNLEETRRAYEQCNREIAKLKSEHSGIAQRAEVIQELEQRLDGVHAGVKQVLALAAESSQTPFGEVHGLVADLVQVHVQHAPLVDVILGDLSQHVVVAGDALLPAIAHPETPLKGRVGFIRLDHLPAPSSALKIDLAGQPGVVGRADQLVRFADHYRPLMEKLLGDTWVVKTMEDALRLQEETTHLIRYTTLDGDLFEKDGTIVVGPRSSSLGLVSRRSELRSLKIQVKELEQQLLQRQAKADDLSKRLTGYEQESERLMGEHTHLARALADQRVTTKAASERHDHLTKSMLALQKEHDGTSQKQAALDASLVEHQSALKLAAAAIEQLAGLLNQRKQSISQLQKASEQDSARLNQLKVEIAKGEQQLAGLEESTRALNVALEERQATGHQLTADLQACAERYVAAQRSILDATSQLADIYIQKDQAVLQHSQILESRERLTADLRKAREVFRTQQQHIKKLESRQHDIELSATQIVHSCTTMTERLRDDYGIEIAKLDIEIDPEIESAKETVEDEISQLRRKINNIGAVNTDALVELEDLESRYLTLDGQYQDLVQAKETLDKIIVRINADSRRLFAETLEAIRQNFQVLYRRTFGGGRADIILEEGVDILDAGIEIVATPPGKPEFNNSLLSGGEKALTAVSLLMAIFQFRPSPFCVLDEVDAPFDEANIGRFVDVLRSFLGWTKFVIVTHSKKTMTAANTLHGVTMEESGVSTRVSVRFDDVTEDGQILSTTNRANTDDDKGAA